MIRLKILCAGEPILRQVSKELTVDEIRSDQIQELIRLMKNTLHDAPGVGLAAPQIGESLQLAVIEDRPEYMAQISPEVLVERERAPVPFHVIINPQLTITDATPVEFFEACLSSKQFIGIVPRARKVRIDCLNEKGEAVTINASGWYARILQHEIDHLHGNLCIDHARCRSLMLMDNYIKYWKDKTMDEIFQQLNISRVQ